VETTLSLEHVRFRTWGTAATPALWDLLRRQDPAAGDVTVLEVDPLAPEGEYPRTLDYHGQAPEQYPEYGEDGEPDWNAYENWGS